MDRKIETVIVGGGQAGLSVSYFLGKAGREHVVLEQASRPAHSWRDERWDSFTLVTPNWSFLVPGAEYDGPEPDGFMGKDEINRRFDRYVEENSLPVEYGVQVTSVDAEEDGYRVKTENGAWHSRNVVIATGTLQAPRIPAFSVDLPVNITQLHSAQYRNPQSLPPGNILVVGSSQSGSQVADELSHAGRKVYLSVCSTGRVPRRYRGRDIVRWLMLVGFFNRTAAQLPNPGARFSGNPQVTGKDGGRSLNLHRFYREGVQLVGRVMGVKDGRLVLAPDLKENLARSDQFELNITRAVDEYIAREGIDAPEETLPFLRDAYEAPEILTLDLKEAGISTIIWATGYRYDYSLVHQPVFDETGFPDTLDGVTHSPGLYFVGMPWLPNQKTGLLLGVGGIARYVAEKICDAGKM